MADKQRILEAISQALDAMGMDSGEEDIYDENGMTSENTVPIWSQLQIGVEDSGRGPIHDKNALFGVKKMTEPQRVDQYGMPMAGDQEEMLSALGLV
jgi:hypothetical protein